jgi:hypothetical protein
VIVMDVIQPSIAPKPTAMQFWVTVNAAAERAWVRAHDAHPIPPEVEFPSSPGSRPVVSAEPVGSMIDVRV